MSTRRLVLLVSACFWLLAVLAGVACARLGIRSPAPFWAICFASGVLASLGTEIFYRSKTRKTWSAAISPIGFALVGLWQLFTGDRSGLILYFMFAGSAVGEVIAVFLERAELSVAEGAAAAKRE